MTHDRFLFFFFLMIRPPPKSTLFPYPTLSRSQEPELPPAAAGTAREELGAASPRQGSRCCGVESALGLRGAAVLESDRRPITLDDLIEHGADARLLTLREAGATGRELPRAPD